MIVRNLAIFLTGLALVAPLADLYELLPEIGLPMERNFMVQGIHRGCLPLVLIADPALAFAGDGRAAWFGPAAKLVRGRRNREAAHFDTGLNS
jgi:hypothetical protein